MLTIRNTFLHIGSPADSCDHSSGSVLYDWQGDAVRESSNGGEHPRRSRSLPRSAFSSSGVSQMQYEHLVHSLYYRQESLKPQECPGPEELSTEDDGAGTSPRSLSLDSETADASASMVSSQDQGAPEIFYASFAGNSLHEQGRCQPCCFFARGRCIQGPQCSFCHESHDRRRLGQKARRRMRARMRLGQEAVLDTLEVVPDERCGYGRVGYHRQAVQQPHAPRVPGPQPRDQQRRQRARVGGGECVLDFSREQNRRWSRNIAEAYGGSFSSNAYSTAAPQLMFDTVTTSYRNDARGENSHDLAGYSVLSL